MGGNMKLLLVAICGVVLAASVLHVSAGSSGPTAYRGGAVNSAVAVPLQQQQASTAAGQASVARLQPMKVVPEAYRDKPSLKDYYYGKKSEDYAAPGAAYGNPGYNSQLPNPSYQSPYAQQQQAAQQPMAQQPMGQQPMGQQPMAGAAYYTPPQQQQYPYQQYQQQPPQYPQYPQQPQYPQYPQQPQYPPQQQPGYTHPEQGYYPAPTPKPYYPPAPAPYYPPTPTPKPYHYPKPDPPKPHVSSICQSEVFGAFYTQPYDDVITPDHELSGVVSAYMGCKDRLTLGGMCSYTCYDGNYMERFVGTTTRITTMPPEDWDVVEPWDHPVYCAWDLGHMALKAMPPPPSIRQDAFNFSCDFTIKAICCDDIVPHVPYGGDVDLGDGGGGGCTDDSCDPIDCEAVPDDPCCICDPETDCPDECLLRTGKQSTNSTRTNTPKKSSKRGGKSKSKRANLASDVGSGHEAGFTSIGNAKVTGGVRTPKQDLVTSMQAVSAGAAQPAVLVAAKRAAAEATKASPAVQVATHTAAAAKAPAKGAASTTAAPASKANSQSR